ncbi:MAG: macro domain-containing protein [Endozoicomonas sp.]
MEPELLAKCYHQALQLVEEMRLSSLAFPAISCDVYGYPHGEAVKIALGTLTGWLKQHWWPDKVVFVLSSPEWPHFMKASWQK